MNFFQYQEKAKKNTAFLVFYFIIAIFLIILALVAVAVAAIIYTYPVPYMDHQVTGATWNYGAITDLTLKCTWYVAPIIIFIIFLGSLLRMLQLRKGGISVAEMVNAEPIHPETNDFLEKRFIHIVEEMSIASGVNMPKLYVMNKEMGINAFVSGIKPQDTVMVVTRGALVHLTRDELQGVVGHEFSHIFNSDMKISLRLMGLLGGLLLIGQIGYIMVRLLPSSNRSERQSGGHIALIILIMGLALLIIGYIGLFFGRLIKAAISRQRERLADACSVQYTRNPQGLVMALRKILALEQGSKLNINNVEDVSHIMFESPRWIMFRSLLGTHPPLDERIKTLDPTGEYSQLPLSEPQIELEPQKEVKRDPMQGFADLMPIIIAAGASAKVDANAILQTIGNPQDMHVQLAQQLLATIPDNIKDLAHNTQQVQLVLYALLLNPKMDKQAIAKILTSTLSATEIENIFGISAQIAALPKSLRLPIVDISITAFKNNGIARKKTILETMQQLASLDEDNLFEFALLTIVSKAIEQRPKRQVGYLSFKNVVPELSGLIWLVLANNNLAQEVKINTYNLIMDKLVKTQPIPSAATLDLQVTFKKLNALAPRCKEKLIQACLACMTIDGKINVEEAELMRAIGASLDCPIPPIVVSE